LTNGLPSTVVRKYYIRAGHQPSGDHGLAGGCVRSDPVSWHLSHVYCHGSLRTLYVVFEGRGRARANHLTQPAGQWGPMIHYSKRVAPEAGAGSAQRALRRWRSQAVLRGDVLWPVSPEVSRMGRQRPIRDAPASTILEGPTGDLSGCTPKRADTSEFWPDFDDFELRDAPKYNRWHMCRNGLRERSGPFGRNMAVPKVRWVSRPPPFAILPPRNRQNSRIFIKPRARAGHVSPEVSPSAAYLPAALSS
jgi:hypothetical protein